VHTPVVGTSEPQLLVSGPVAVSDLGAYTYLVLTLAARIHYYPLRNSFSCHLICGYLEIPRYHIPPPNSHILLGMYDCQTLQSEESGT